MNNILTDLNDESSRPWFDAVNVSGEDCPPYACIRFLPINDDGVLTFSKPAASNVTAGLAFNRGATVANGEIGRFHRTLPGLAAIQPGDGSGSGSLHIGSGADHDETTWGPVAGSWYLSPNGFGYRALSGYLCPDPSSPDCVQAILVIDDDGKGNTNDDGSGGSGGSGSGEAPCDGGPEVNFCLPDGSSVTACLISPASPIKVIDSSGNRLG